MMENDTTRDDDVRAFIAALEVNDLTLAGSYLTDDFLANGWTPLPLDKKGFLSVIGGLKAGIPGLIFNMHNITHENDEEVNATFQIAGYQTDSFILPTLGLPPVPQMARSVSMPTEDVSFTFLNGKMKILTFKHTEGGGIIGLLHQLGFDVPIVQ